MGSGPHSQRNIDEQGLEARSIGGRLCDRGGSALGQHGRNSNFCESPQLKFVFETATVQDPDIAALLKFTPNLKPRPLVAGQDYGLDFMMGKFVWPKATPRGS